MELQAICNRGQCVLCADSLRHNYGLCISQGTDDRQAFMASVDLLEQRHPGHDRNYYFHCVAQLLGGLRQSDNVAS